MHMIRNKKENETLPPHKHSVEMNEKLNGNFIRFHVDFDAVLFDSINFIRLFWIKMLPRPKF